MIPAWYFSLTLLLACQILDLKAFIVGILFSKYFLVFELVSLVLLIGMIGAVVIGRKEAQTYEDHTP